MLEPRPSPDAAIERALTMIKHGAYWDGFNGPTGVTKDEVIEAAHEALVAARDALAALPVAQDPEPGLAVLDGRRYRASIEAAGVHQEGSVWHTHPLYRLVPLPDPTRGAEQ